MFVGRPHDPVQPAGQGPGTAANRGAPAQSHSADDTAPPGDYAVLECLDARLAYDPRWVSVLWHDGGYVQLPTASCVTAEARHVEEAGAVQFTIRFLRQAPAPVGADAAGTVAIRLSLRPEHSLSAHEVAHLLTVRAHQRAVAAGPPSGGPEGGPDAAGLVEEPGGGRAEFSHASREDRPMPQVGEHAEESLPSYARLRVAPDTGEWISFQPGNATAEFIDGMHVPSAGADARAEHDG